MEPYRLKGGEAVVSSLEKACLPVLGFKPRRVTGELAGDENHLANRFNVPTVSYGPDGGNMHGAEEYASLSSTVKAANIYLRALTIFLRS
jgi:acetylornithine deacetylase/succinyl-diaminopimelate desuccinylase-like protein